MQFDMTDLRLFVLAAEEGNLTRAAGRQHISLAAASARIKSLEAQAGLPLLYREARGVRLTPPGEAFAHHARELLRQADHLRRDLHDYGGGLRGHLRVFANTTAVSGFLPEILPAYLAANPRVNVDLQEKPNAEIARGVLEGRCDLGIVSTSVDTMGLEAIHFSTDRLVLVMPRRHRFARRRQIAFVETLDEDMVGMHDGSTLQSFLHEQAEALGRSMKMRIQISSFDAVCRIIGAGVGIGVVPESAARRNLAAMNLAQVELADAWRVRERYILMRDREELPAYAQALVDVLCAHHRG
ncbi:LysR substrate-binding domain-containing protein [Ramlibacter sp.]|uniref:LysR substrate-binding domain-containing protein n=1 Tax=Ramlibacter sp. TaxID=1917967 RepID=UPI003D0BB4C9